LKSLTKLLVIFTHLLYPFESCQQNIKDGCTPKHLWYHYTRTSIRFAHIALPSSSVAVVKPLLLLESGSRRWTMNESPTFCIPDLHKCWSIKEQTWKSNDGKRVHPAKKYFTTYI